MTAGGRVVKPPIYFHRVLQKKGGGEGVDTSRKNAYVINGKTLSPMQINKNATGEMNEPICFKSQHFAPNKNQNASILMTSLLNIHYHT